MNHIATYTGPTRKTSERKTTIWNRPGDNVIGHHQKFEGRMMPTHVKPTCALELVEGIIKVGESDLSVDRRRELQILERRFVSCDECDEPKVQVLPYSGKEMPIITDNMARKIFEDRNGSALGSTFAVVRMIVRYKIGLDEAHFEARGFKVTNRAGIAEKEHPAILNMYLLVNKFTTDFRLDAGYMFDYDGEPSAIRKAQLTKLKNNTIRSNERPPKRDICGLSVYILTRDDICNGP